MSTIGFGEDREDASWPVQLQFIRGLSMEHWVLYGLIESHARWYDGMAEIGHVDTRRKIAEDMGWHEDKRLRKFDRVVRDLEAAGVVRKERKYRHVRYYPLFNGALMDAFNRMADDEDFDYHGKYSRSGDGWIKDGRPLRPASDGRRRRYRAGISE